MKSFCYFVCSFPISFYIHYAIVYQPFVNPVAVGLCTVYYFFVNFIAHSSINAQSPRSEVVGFGGNFFFKFCNYRYYVIKILMTIRIEKKIQTPRKSINRDI